MQISWENTLETRAKSSKRTTAHHRLRDTHTASPAPGIASLVCGGRSIDMSSTLAKDAVPWLLAFMIVYCDRVFAFVMRKIRPAPRPRAANGGRPAVVFSRASIRKQHTTPSFAPLKQEPPAANTTASTTASIAASAPTTELLAPGTNANGALLPAPTPVASLSLIHI